MTKSEDETTTNINLNIAPLRNMIIIMVVGLAISLILAIILTVFAHKARMKCSRNIRYSHYSVIILVFLLCLWLGGLIPYAGPLISMTGLIGSIVMLVLAKKHC